MVIRSYIPIITLNVNGLNAPIKRHRLAEQMKTCAFNLLMFKVIIDMYDPITIFLIVLGLFSVGRSFPSLVSCLENFL